jgi:hypothetical protein
MMFICKVCRVPLLGATQGRSWVLLKANVKV